MQTGSADSAGLRHCATFGARHDTSQRLPLFSALHELALAELESIADVVPPTLVELVTPVELLELIDCD